MSEPLFLKDLKEKRDAAQREVSEGRDAWGRAQDAILKFPGWELTGEYRQPKKGEAYFYSITDNSGITEAISNHTGTNPPRFILRKVEPVLEPKPEPDREEAIRKAKREAFSFRSCEYDGKNQFAKDLLEAVEAIPDREPFPLLDKLREFSELKQNWDSYGSPPITPEALRVARLLCGSPKWIAPVAGGGIAISWDQPDEDPGIEILPSGKLRGDEDEPSPRVVWACPEEIVNSIKIFKKIIEGDHRLSPDIGLSATLTGKYQCLLDELLKGCRSTCVVWACPGEVIERIENIKRWADTWDKPGISDKCEKLLSLCHSTREATVEEFAKGLGTLLPDANELTKQAVLSAVSKLVEDLAHAGIRLVKEG